MKLTFLSLLVYALACAGMAHAATIDVTPGSGTLRTAVTNAAAESCTDASSVAGQLYHYTALGTTLE